MTPAFITEGISHNTKAADIVSHYSNLHIIAMSSSVALFLDRCTQIICNNINSYFILGGKIISISVKVAISGRPHLHNKKSIDWIFQMFVDVEHQL